MSKKKVSPYLKLAFMAVIAQWLLVLSIPDISQISLLCALASSGLLFLLWVASNVAKLPLGGGFLGLMIYSFLVVSFLHQFRQALGLTQTVNRWYFILPSILLILYSFISAYRRNKKTHTASNSQK